LELKNYQTIQGRSCPLACVNSILNYFNLQVEEGLLYNLAGGLRYIYDQNLEKNGVYKIHTDVPNTLEKLLFGCKIKYVIENNINDTQGVETILRNLSEDKPIIIGVRNCMLPYDPEFVEHDKEMGHLITITGIDVENNRIKISDSFIPSSPPRVFHDWCSLDVILKAHNEIKNWSLSIDKESVRVFCKENSHDDIMRMTEKKLIEALESLINGKIENQTYYGIEAFKKYGVLLRNFTTQFKDNFAEQIYRQNIYLKMEGFLVNKYYLLDTLTVIMEKRSDDRLKAVSIRLFENTKKWSKFCLLLVKTSLLDDMSSMSNVCDTYDELYEKELNIYENLLGILRP